MPYVVAMGLASYLCVCHSVCCMLWSYRCIWKSRCRKWKLINFKVKLLKLYTVRSLAIDVTKATVPVKLITIHHVCFEWTLWVNSTSKFVVNELLDIDNILDIYTLLSITIVCISADFCNIVILSIYDERYY